jgi:hypothetical protein
MKEIYFSLNAMNDLIYWFIIQTNSLIHNKCLFQFAWCVFFKGVGKVVKTKSYYSQEIKNKKENKVLNSDSCDIETYIDHNLYVK